MNEEGTFEYHSQRARRMSKVPRLRDSFLWPHPGKGPWVVTLWFAELDGRMECVGLDLRSFDTDRDGRPKGHPDRDLRRLTATTKRELPLAELIDKRLELYAEHLLDVSEHGSGQEQLAADKPLRALAATPRRNKPGRPPALGSDHFREVARVYSEAFKAGLKNPTARVAEWGHVSKSAAAKWVARARAMGLLPPTSRGRAAGSKPGRKRKAKS